MNPQPPATALAATLSGALAMIVVALVPDIGFILQAVGVGPLVGTAVVLRLEWCQRRRGQARLAVATARSLGKPLLRNAVAELRSWLRTPSPGAASRATSTRSSKQVTGRALEIAYGSPAESPEGRCDSYPGSVPLGPVRPDTHPGRTILSSPWR
jgi:hypothetical protein